MQLINLQLIPGIMLLQHNRKPLSNPYTNFPTSRVHSIQPPIWLFLGWPVLAISLNNDVIRIMYQTSLYGLRPKLVCTAFSGWPFLITDTRWMVRNHSQKEKMVNYVPVPIRKVMCVFNIP